MKIDGKEEKVDKNNPIKQILEKGAQVNIVLNNIRQNYNFLHNFLSQIYFDQVISNLFENFVSETSKH